MLNRGILFLCEVRRTTDFLLLLTRSLQSLQANGYHESLLLAYLPSCGPPLALQSIHLRYRFTPFQYITNVGARSIHQLLCGELSPPKNSIQARAERRQSRRPPKPNRAKQHHQTRVKQLETTMRPPPLRNRALMEPPSKRSFKPAGHCPPLPPEPQCPGRRKRSVVLAQVNW